MIELRRRRWRRKVAFFCLHFEFFSRLHYYHVDREEKNLIERNRKGVETTKRIRKMHHLWGRMMQTRPKKILIHYKKLQRHFFSVKVLLNYGSENFSFNWNQKIGLWYEYQLLEFQINFGINFPTLYCSMKCCFIISLY